MKEPPKPQRPERGEIGATGTTLLAGIISGAEYNSDLQGQKGIDTYTRMFKADATARAIERAITLPIRSAVWSTVAATDSAQDKEIADFVDHNLHAMTITWDDALRHALYKGRYGRYLFEKVFEERDGRYAWRKWAPRQPGTVSRWYFDDAGGVLGIQQRTWKYKEAGLGKIASGEYAMVDIPIEKLLIYVNEREGSNYEGESWGRSFYKSWFLKDTIERIMAIGVERREIGTEYAKVSDEASKADQDALMLALSSLHASERGSIVFPAYVTEQGVLGQAPGRSTSMEFLEYLKREMATSALAEFLTMGAQSGTQAMHRDKTSFFLLGLKAVAQEIEDTTNAHAIKQLVDLNFAGVTDYPRLEVSRLETRNIAEFSAAVIGLANAGALTIDRVDEEALRHELDMPDLPEEDDEEAAIREERRVKTPPAPFGQQPQDGEEQANPERPPRLRAMQQKRHWRGYSTRERRPAEKYVDLAAIENRMNRGQQRIVRAAQDVIEKQIDKLVEISGGIIEADDASARVDRIEVPYTNQMATAILGEMKDLYSFGAEDMRKELDKAGAPKTAENVIEPERGLEFLRARARAFASILAAKLKATFAMETLQQVKTGVADPERLRTRLTDLSTRELEAGARFSVSEAVNFGRQATAEDMDDEIDYAEYSCLLDSNSCPNCAERDGQQFQVGTAEYYLNRPPLTECEGGNQCRCLYVYVMKGEGS